MMENTGSSEKMETPALNGYKQKRKKKRFKNQHKSHTLELAKVTPTTKDIYPYLPAYVWHGKIVIDQFPINKGNHRNRKCYDMDGQHRQTGKLNHF